MSCKPNYKWLYPTTSLTFTEAEEECSTDPECKMFAKCSCDWFCTGRGYDHKYILCNGLSAEKTDRDCSTVYEKEGI